MSSDALGPDGSVRLHRYLPLATSLYFAGSCPTCGRVVTVGVEAAIELMGSGEATIGEVSARLRCRPCGGRVDLAVCPDTRSVDTQKRDGPLPETMGLKVRE
jgi:hypothetical protein